MKIQAFQHLNPLEKVFTKKEIFDAFGGTTTSSTKKLF